MIIQSLLESKQNLTLSYEHGVHFLYSFIQALLVFECFCLFVCFSSDRDQTQSLAHVSKILYPWDMVRPKCWFVTLFIICNTRAMFFFVTNVCRNELQDCSEDKSDACMSPCCFTLHCVCVYAITEKRLSVYKKRKDNNVWS